MINTTRIGLFVPIMPRRRKTVPLPEDPAYPYVAPLGIDYRELNRSDSSHNEQSDEAHNTEPYPAESLSAGAADPSSGLLSDPSYGLLSALLPMMGGQRVITYMRMDSGELLYFVVPTTSHPQFPPDEQQLHNEQQPDENLYDDMPDLVW